MRKRYPNNGMVDSWGKLTAMGQAAVAEFGRCYANPMGFLRAKWPDVAGRVLRQIDARLYTVEDFNATVLVHATVGVRSFDPDGGSAVNTYLAWRIVAAATHLADAHDRQSHLSYDSFFTAADGESFADTIPAPERADHPWPELDTLRPLVSRREWAVLESRFMHGKTLREVADDMGLSKDRVRQIEAAALDSIRRRVRLPARPVLLN